MKVFYQLNAEDGPDVVLGEEHILWECNTTWGWGCAEKIAEDCARDAWVNHGAKDTSWPFEILLWKDENREMAGLVGRYKVELEIMPGFIASPIDG